ncbi:MAG TPA: chloride channel protein [Bryobacteraceae bacterium]|nr:chloride channel protein [Bryobacteraceae bacterium]
MSRTLAAGPSSKTWKTRLEGWWSQQETLRQHEDKIQLVLTLFIGALVGVVVAAFIYVTENLGARFYPAGGSPWRRLLVPTSGALITGYFLWRFFPNARGSGIPQTKVALFLRDGFITFRTAFGKFFCCSASLASGIALGREGPSVQVGAGLASVLGRRLGLGPSKIRELIPVGCAAALAAAFNTPVAAVLFTLEEVMGDMHAPVLGSIVLSSATAWVVLHLLLGDEPLFHVPAYQLVSPLEFIVYALLGVVGGLVSVCFTKLLLLIRKRFMELPKWSEWLQPTAGGLLVGVMGWFVPQVLGVGYGHVSEALNGQMTLKLMLLLVALKVIATASCYGTGNAGGIFGPALFIGAMMGGGVGAMAHQLLPDYTGSVGAYALVGMGAAFAGIVRVPLTSVIMIFEMTRDYSIIVPLMISNLMSFYISYRLQEEPIYEALQHQDGVHLPALVRYRQGMLVVRDAVRAPAHVLSTSHTMHDALSMLHTGRNAWPVLMDGEQSRLAGMISLEQVQREIEAGNGGARLGDALPTHLPAPELTAEKFPHVHLDHPADVALRRMAVAKMNVLPVVSRSNIRELKGVVSLDEILHAYGAGPEPEEGAREPAVAPAKDAGAARKFVPGMIAATVVLLTLIAFLNYYYRSTRTARAQAYFKAGNELVEQGRNEEASEQFRDALSIAPQNAQYRLALGLSLELSDHPTEALVYLDELVKRDPDNGPANLGIARIRAAQRQISEAVTYYHKAIYGSWPAGGDQNRMQARLELAEFLRKNSQGTQAVAELLAALGPAAHNAEEKRNIGRLLMEYGAPRQSVSVFQDLLRSNSRDAQAWAGLGAAQLAQDNFAAARDAFRNAVRWNPADTDSQKELEFCEMATALDPSAPKLRSAERHERSVTLLQEELANADACRVTVTAPAQSQPLSQLADSARKALAQHPSRAGLEDSTDNNLTLALNLWKADQTLCGSKAALGNLPLDRVLAKLSKQ